jgi:hypothetical protein
MNLARDVGYTHYLTFNQRRSAVLPIPD